MSEPLISRQPMAMERGHENSNVHRTAGVPMKDIEMASMNPLACTLGMLVCPLTFLGSFYTLAPREEAIITSFGTLVGHETEPGCHWHNCVGRDMRRIFTTRISVDVPTTKITDSHGNPLMVSAVLNYRFTDARAALLNVQNPSNYVNQQAQAVLKMVVSRFSYDELKTEAEAVTRDMVNALQPRVVTAGATIESVSLNELNYAPEIAAAMLKKQQARALIDARQLIVKGAVDIASTAVAMLEAKGLTMSPSDRVKIVTNILTVTCSETDATPTLTL